MKTTLGDFLTDEQIQKCIILKKAKLIKEQVIEPNIDTINEKIGQKNDPLYIAYLCEFAVSQIK